jgi:hypothetical protein
MLAAPALKRFIGHRDPMLARICSPVLLFDGCQCRHCNSSFQNPIPASDTKIAVPNGMVLSIDSNNERFCNHWLSNFILNARAQARCDKVIGQIFWSTEDNRRLAQQCFSLVHVMHLHREFAGSGRVHLLPLQCTARMARAQSKVAHLCQTGSATSALKAMPISPARADRRNR